MAELIWSLGSEKGTQVQEVQSSEKGTGRTLFQLVRSSEKRPGLELGVRVLWLRMGLGVKG